MRSEIFAKGIRIFTLIDTPLGVRFLMTIHTRAYTQNLQEWSCRSHAKNDLLYGACFDADNHECGLIIRIWHDHELDDWNTCPFTCEYWIRHFLDCAEHRLEFFFEWPRISLASDSTYSIWITKGWEWNESLTYVPGQYKGWKSKSRL